MLRFDDAIPAAVNTLREILHGSLPPVTLVRDLTGGIAAILPADALPADGWDAAAARLSGALERYGVGEQRVLLRESDLLDRADVLESQDRIKLVEFAPDQVWLVDRLLTNQDWLRAGPGDAPLTTASAFSIKGGLGRSTALAVLAWHFARLGKRVLVIDLDLEAPGIGSMLLRELPEVGVVDWFVETLTGPPDPTFLDNAMGRAALDADTDGSVLVMPAFGLHTHDYVAKLGRAYMPTADETGRLVGFSERLRALISLAADRLEPPDLVLIDCRAGLHDIGAAAVTQVGAEAFLFARNDAPTWDAYRRLFDHLRHSRAVTWGMPDSDLRWRLKMVAAQSEPTEDAIRSWISHSYSTWLTLYDEGADLNRPDHIFQETDDAAPHHPMTIFFDPGVRKMDFIDPSRRPDWAFVSAVFGQFLNNATQRLIGDALD